MLKNLLFIGIILLHSISQSQETEKKDNRTSFRPGVFWYFDGLSAIKHTDVRKYDRLIFDVTYNDWQGDRELFRNHWASIGFNTNLMFDIPVGKNKKGGLGIGFSYGFTNIRHDKFVYVDEEKHSTQILDNLTPSDFKKGALTYHSFSIPFELRYRGKEWSHFKIHFGTKIGYQPNIRSRSFYSGNGYNVEYRRVGLPDDNNILYSVYLRVGIRNYALYANYQMNTLFSSIQSSQLNVFQFGVSISLF